MKDGQTETKHIHIFFPDGTDGDYYLRLNFVIQRPDEIEAGIKRLAMK